ncbi:MAG: hypothetical protein ACJAZY_001250 [Spirosomataceae bacterium]|jgi:hypothetical protein
MQIVRRIYGATEELYAKEVGVESISEIEIAFYLRALRTLLS